MKAVNVALLDCETHQEMLVCTYISWIHFLLAKKCCTETEEELIVRATGKIMESW